MFVIAYESNSTVNGKSVGAVFVLHCPEIDQDVFSYTRDIVRATHYPTRQETEAVIAGKWWTKARVVEM